MTDYKTIALEISSGVATITLKRDPLNVLNIAMMDEINNALESLKQGSDLKLFAFRAEGKAFSAGVDVSEHTADLVDKMISTFHQMFRLLDKFECPTVALVHGAALGGGCELACFCDMVVAASGVKFGQPEIKVGVFPPVAAASFASSANLKSIYELLLSGDTIKAEEALSIGLINRIFPRDEFAEASAEWVKKIASNSASILRLTKKSIRASQGKPFSEALDVAEKIYLGEMMATEDAHEGLTAFMEKRAPVWKDK